MESPELDIKPIIPVDLAPERCSLTAPSVDKLKQSRYEDVWPEDVHAAFMEAVALYPPMGKRRLKYYRVSTDGNGNERISDANQTKSFGRCQLIQSYILEKTGKNRSRKQVSSHLQRLKKIHKDNASMRYLFSERSQLPPERCSAPQTIAVSSQDGSANVSVSTCHLKSDLDFAINLQNTGPSTDISTFPCAPLTSTINDGSCSALDFPMDLPVQSSLLPQEFLSPAAQQRLGAFYPPESNYLSELQDTLLFKDAIHEGLRAGSAFNTSAFSISMRRLVPRLPMQGQPVGSDLTAHLSRTLQSPGPQPIHQWIHHESLMDSVSYDSPLVSAQEGFYAPFLPLQLIPPDKQLDTGLASEWMWSQNSDVPLIPREGTYGELHLRYPPATYQYYPTHPEMRANTPVSLRSPPESEFSRLLRGISYSYAVTSPVIVSESISNKSAIDLHRQSSELPENLASPPVIRPTPVYPISYVHTANNHFDGRTPAPTP